MSTQRVRRQHGVTLAELLVALAIAALVLAPLSALLRTSVLAGGAHAGRALLEQDLHFALDRIGNEIRATPRKVLSPQNTALTDSGAWLDKSRFRINASKQLIEVRDGVDNVVAESVAVFGISARSVGLDATIVESTLKLERGADTVQGRIAVRMGGPRL